MENKRKASIEIKVSDTDINNFNNNFKTENEEKMEVLINTENIGKTLILSQTLLQTLIYTNARLIAKNEGVVLKKVLEEIELIKEDYLKENIKNLNQ